MVPGSGPVSLPLTIAMLTRLSGWKEDTSLASTEKTGRPIPAACAKTRQRSSLQFIRDGTTCDREDRWHQVSIAGGG